VSQVATNLKVICQNVRMSASEDVRPKVTMTSGFLSEVRVSIKSGESRGKGWACLHGASQIGAHDLPKTACETVATKKVVSGRISRINVLGAGQPSCYQIAELG
jgi:hypothetical protein